MRSRIAETERCVKAVYSASFTNHRRQCERRGVVERNGKRYCRQHDPVSVDARRTDEIEQAKSRNLDQERIRDRAKELAQRLGCGMPHYNFDPRQFRNSGYTDALVVNFADVEALLRVLGR